MAESAVTELGVLSRIDGLLAVLGPVEGLDVIDIGCGMGEVARALAGRGATVTGYDPFIAPTERVEAGAGSYQLKNATADAIPEPDGSADLVLFVFSLHHVPQVQLAGALAEARRMLKPGGRLVVAEPVAEGPSQYVAEPYHDETKVRKAAADALAAHAAPAFAEQRVYRFADRRKYSSFDAFATRAMEGMRFNGYTEADILSAEVRRRFDETFAVTGGTFDQPIRVNLFAS
jgi:ubiquinone/menaquinone biosynthesis C-methylase UbiE